MISTYLVQRIQHALGIRETVDTRKHNVNRNLLEDNHDMILMLCKSLALPARAGWRARASRHVILAEGGTAKDLGIAHLSSVQIKKLLQDSVTAAQVVFYLKPKEANSRCMLQVKSGPQGLRLWTRLGLIRHDGQTLTGSTAMKELILWRRDCFMYRQSKDPIARSLGCDCDRVVRCDTGMNVWGIVLSIDTSPSITSQDSTNTVYAMPVHVAFQPLG